MKLKVFVLVTFSALYCLTSCTTQRINLFNTFAKAGNSYSAAIDALTEEACNIAIDADSEILIKDRDKFTDEERRKIYQEKAKAIEALLETMHNFQTHTSLLNRYFTSISKLAEYDNQKTILLESEKAISSLQKIHPQLENATIGGATPKELMGSIIPILVANFKQKNLEEELHKNANIIERELELQIALLSVLSEEMKADMDILMKAKDYNIVAGGYISNGELPSDWKNERKELLTMYNSMGSFDSALSAAKELKITYINLLENKINLSDFNMLFEDINSMVTLIELLQANNK